MGTAAVVLDRQAVLIASAVSIAFRVRSATDGAARKLARQMAPTPRNPPRRDKAAQDVLDGGSMASSDKSVAATLVLCEVRLKQIPKSEATVSQAVDYFVYFSGPDCYEKWKTHRSAAVEQVEKYGC
jgi:hypothetical protein